MTITVNNSADQNLLNDEIGLYQVVFGRQPDAGGLDYWYNQGQAHGDDIGYIANVFIPAAILAEAPTDFLVGLYANAFGRVPDQGGLTYWLGQIDSHAVTYGEVALTFVESPEFQAHIAKGVTGLVVGGVTTTLDPTMPLPGAPVFTLPQPVIQTVTNTVDVFVPTPTAETHVVAFGQDTGVDLAGTDGVGHMLTGTGNANAGYYVANDQTANVALYLQPIYRQSATIITPDSVTQSGNDMTVTYTMAAGTQGHLGTEGNGVNTSYSDISLNFGAIGLNIGNNPNTEILLDVQGAAGFTAEYHLVVNSAGKQAWENASNTPVILDNNNSHPSTVAAENSENFSFGIFGGTAILPTGTYTETIKLVGTSGLNNGVVLAQVTDVIHAV